MKNKILYAKRNMISMNSTTSIPANRITFSRMAGRMRIVFAASLLALILSARGPAQAQEQTLDVMHWWTSGSEVKALDILRKDLRLRGVGWKDSQIAGGDDRKRPILNARIGVGRNPDAAMMHSFNIRSYAQEGLLLNLDDLAARERWDDVVYAPLQRLAKYQEHWVAAPANIHRANWIWANKKIFDQLKLAPPRTFDEFVAAAEKINSAGYLPLAHGGQPWQDTLLFDNAVLSVGGAMFYRDALIKLDPAALGSDTMRRVFEQLLRLRGMIDRNSAGREWNAATALVIRDVAAMQIMGDWAKGEFLKAGKKPNVDFLCFPYPDTSNSYIFVTDLFGMFRNEGKRIKAQHTLADAIMDRDMQEEFNLTKGSIPARIDASLKNFDDCGTRSAADFQKAIEADTAVERFVAEIPETARLAVYGVMNDFFRSSQTPEEAVKLLAAAVMGAKARK